MSSGCTATDGSDRANGTGHLGALQNAGDARQDPESHHADGADGLERAVPQVLGCRSECLPPVREDRLPFLRVDTLQVAHNCSQARAYAWYSMA